MNDVVIKCPYCNTEYLPAELIYPREFFGTPKQIIKDANSHKILSYQGNSLQLTENYICDVCDSLFSIKSKISFTTIKNPNFDFGSTYTTSLKSNPVLLSEDE